MKGLKRRVERGALAVVLALCLAGRAAAQLAEPVQASTEDLLQMTEESALRERTLWLSGPVPPVRILSERIEGGLYFIEVETALSRLLNKNGGIYVAGEMQRLKRNNAHAR